MKKLFLLCAQLYHHSIDLKDLVRYAMGLDLFKGRETVKEVTGRLHKYLCDLKGCCLLQDGNKEGTIKMHDVVHKFASSMASEYHGVLIVANGDQLRRWPSKEQFEKLKAISFFGCRLPHYHELSIAFDKPNLESFIMVFSMIDASFQIPDNFFAGMKGLKLMDLTLMSLSSILVSSLGALVKLQTLCLDGCQLSDISVIGELPKLQVLSLISSSIVLVPKEIGKLGSTLKMLDLSHCSKLETIASGVISKLTSLEDLRIGDSYKHWKRLEGNPKRSDIVDETKEVEMASMEEFKNLQNLIHLDIHVDEPAKMFPKDLVFTKLETFKIFFGSRRLLIDDYICYGAYMQSSSDYISTRILEVSKLATSVEFDSDGSKALMTNAESLSLTSFQSSVNIISEMDPKGFPELKYLTVEPSRGIQYIVKKIYNDCIFPKLETLNLASLGNLKSICDDHPLPVGSFQNLRVLNVKKCKLLNDLLSSNLARCLLRLEEIRVVDCTSMKSIIVLRESEEITHQLRVLKLFELPCLVSFYNFKQLEELPSPTPFFNKKIMLPKLEVLLLNNIKMEKIWDDHVTMTVEGNCWIQNLTSLKVFACVNLSYLFTFSMVKSLSKLQEVKVDGCDSIKGIVATREGETVGECVLLFPKLEKLRLQNLLKLKRFCHANLLECQALQTLCIVRCPLLKTFNGDNKSSLFDEKIVFSKLEVLELSEMKIEKIWDIDHLAKETTCWFQNLTSMEVYVCHNVSYLFTSAMVESLANLKQLQVRCCDSIEEIVASTGNVQLSFPKLDNIELINLPNLRRFCKANLPQCQLLRKLVIRECSKLKTFVSANDDSSSDNNSTTLFTEKIAFPNMEELKIANCDSLENVFDIQVLPMNEFRILPPPVYASEDDEFIVFEKLKSLDLQDLNSLTSFCSTSDCNLRFPSLDRVIVKNCPEMKFFCKGALSTTKLRTVEDGEGNERRLEGDLNSTIRQLFEENAGTSNMDENEDEHNVEDKTR